MNTTTIKQLTALLGVICGLVINVNAQTIINTSTTVSGTWNMGGGLAMYVDNGGTSSLTLQDNGRVTVGGYYDQQSLATLNIIVGNNTPQFNAGAAYLDGTLNLDLKNTGTLRASEVPGTRMFFHSDTGFNGTDFATKTGTSSEDYVTFLSHHQTANDYTAEYDLSWNQNLHGNFTVSGSTTFIVDTALVDQPTGTLSGTHRLNITNQGGDNGNDFNITLATAANHDNGTFVSDFDIGMFTYELQGSGTRYYITRATAPTPDPTPQPGPTGEDLLADLPSQSQAWFDNMNNISNHLGDLRVTASVNASGARERRPLGGGILDAVWIKSYGQQVNVSGKVVGAAFREYQYGVDVGADHRWTLDKNNTLIAGAFVGYGSLDRTLRNGLQNDGSTDNYHFGLYGIWLHESGLYADVIAKGQYADHEVNAWDASNNHTTADYNNWGGGVTLDIGKQFKFKDGWFVEPSLSAGYAHFTGESYTAHNTSPFAVTISDADVFQFKLGVQFGRTIALSNGGILQPYIKVAGVEQASTGGKLRASGAEWRPTLDGASAEIGGGVIWQLDTQHSLTLDYEASFGNKYDKPWGLTAGYRYQF